MKILHVASGMDPKAGGISQAVRTMARGLHELGVTNDVVTIGTPPDHSPADEPFPIFYTGPGKTPWQYCPALSGWLKGNLARYDAVLVHGLWQHHTHAVYQAISSMRDARPKVFVMPHGMLDPWFQSAKGREIKAARNRMIWQLFEQKLVHLADGLLFTCETEKQLASTTFRPYRPQSELVTGLGVDAPPAYTSEMQHAFQPPKGGPYLLFLGRIDVKKGVDLLVEAYLRLKSNGHHLPPLVIAGPGMDTPFGTQLRNAARHCADITFPGMLSGAAKWAAFYGCEAFVLPSHQENFGIAVVEALACSKPVLISDQVNIWREIKDNGGGLVGKDTPQGVEQMLAEWLDLSKTQKASASSRARAIYQTHYAVEQAARNLYEALAAAEMPVLS